MAELDRLRAADGREDLAWLLDLEWAGSVWRYSGRERSVTVDGSTVVYRGGLVWGGDLDDDLEAGGGAGVISLTFSIDGRVAPPIAQFIADGIWPEHATVRLWQWSSSSERRVLRLEGAVESFAYGEEGEPFAFGVEQGTEPERGLLLPPTAAVGAETFSSTGTGREDIMGVPYPIIIGSPGKLDAAASGAYSTITVVPGSEAMLANSGTLVVADGHVAGGTVRLEDSAGNVDAVATVRVTDVDALLRPVSVILTGDTTLTLSASEEYRIAWTGAGGMLGGDGEVMRGAGDLLLWAARRSTWRWDLPWLESVAPGLNRYELDGVIQGLPDEPVRPSAWILESLLPILPVALRRSARGLRVVPIPWGAVAEDATATIEHGANATRVGRYQEDDSFGGVANEITVSFAYNLRTDQPARVVVLSGSVTRPEDPPQAELHPLLARSVSRYRRMSPTGVVRDPGVRPLGIESRLVYSERTARLVALSAVALRGMPPLRAVYSIPGELGATLDPGDVVALTDEPMGVAGRVAVVSRVVRTVAPRTEVELLIWDWSGV